MPELPEVETIVRELRGRIEGKTVQHVQVLRRDVIYGADVPIEEHLLGRSIGKVTRRAKRITFDFKPPTRVVFHLGMSGRLNLVPCEEELKTHTHLTLTFEKSRHELRFVDPRRFGGVWLLDGTYESSTGRSLGPLGPEPFDLIPAKFALLLQRQKQIKALLLDQTLIAGLGNIYCDEALHAAGVHPTSRAGEIEADDTRRLLRAIKSTLHRAIRHRGSTLVDYRRANGDPGSFQRLHRVYNREGQPCKRCRTPIERMQVAGRSSYFCPACQPVRDA